MTALETRIASLTADQLCDVLRDLATNSGDEAARITTAGLSYCSFCDELYGAWG